MKKIFALNLLALVLTTLLFFGCNQTNNKTEEKVSDDTIAQVEQKSIDSLPATDSTDKKGVVEQKIDLPKVLVYNFHITNRCVSCIAIEKATTKTLNTYFSSELKQGRVKQFILNVDEDANAKIAEKYQAFGSGLYVTRVFKGKETTTDLTGDGFKFAKNKEEKFIEILKNRITEYLK
ncbi:MAG TPA: nitrophenyl compound nitroreductase subunit ArsF family protein [Bacteroidales bacterium]|nr:nitrophenyl compound nitroreductase subunit ArsF family protein [Bacteroidales bacterium]